MMRQGSVDDCQRTPFILGTECSGYIEALGKDVEDFKVKREDGFIDLIIYFCFGRVNSKFVSIHSRYGVKVYHTPNVPILTYIFLN